MQETTEPPVETLAVLDTGHKGSPSSGNDSAGKKPGNAKKRKKKTTSRLFLEFLIKITVIAAAVWALLTFVIGITIHYGNNMYPAIRDGDLVISYRLQKPYLNAAVLYERNGEICAGRIVGMQGNEINIAENGQLTVNGVAPAEEIFYATYRPEEDSFTYPFTVGEGQVFILNDFRSDQADSRKFGTVEMKNVQGPVLLVIRRRGF